MVAVGVLSSLGPGWTTPASGNTFFHELQVKKPVFERTGMTNALPRGLQDLEDGGDPLMVPYTVCSDLNMSAKPQCRLNKKRGGGTCELNRLQMSVNTRKERSYSVHMLLKSISWHSKVRAGA